MVRQLKPGRILKALTNDQLIAMRDKYNAQIVSQGFETTISWHDGAHGEGLEQVMLIDVLELIIEECEIRGIALPSDAYKVTDSAKAVL